MLIYPAYIQYSMGICDTTQLILLLDAMHEQAGIAHTKAKGQPRYNTMYAYLQGAETAIAAIREGLANNSDESMRKWIETTISSIKTSPHRKSEYPKRIAPVVDPNKPEKQHAGS